MANGKVIYPSGEISQTTYSFPKNFDYGQEIGYLETADNSRAFDGSLNNYQGGSKKYFDLTFSFASKTQFEYFMTLWTLHCPLDLYLDGSSGSPDASVLITKPPSGQSQPAFVSNAYTVTFTVHMEEV